MKKTIAAFSVFILFFTAFFNEASAAQEAGFDAQLDAYIAEISDIRGYSITKEDLIFVLDQYGYSLQDFDTVDELSEFLGEVIKTDLSNLQTIYEDYELDQASLEALLEEYGEEISDYIFLDDLYASVAFYSGDEMMDEEFLKELLAFLATDFDLTDQEIENLMAHLLSIEDHLMDPATMQRVEQLTERMMNLEFFETATELTADQIAELLSIFDEMLDIYQVKAEYVLITKDTEQTISLLDLINMDELINAKLKINLFNQSGKFLADIIITGEMFDSELINDAGKNLGNSAAAANQSAKTVKGGELPNTASNNLLFGLAGLMMLLLGSLVVKRAWTR